MNLTDEMRPPHLAHILFYDIVAFSTLPVAQQARALDRLNAAAAESPAFQGARARDAVLVLPTGDGMALVFHEDLTAPARCAREVADTLQDAVPLRAGIHSGLVQMHLDLAGRENLVGEGINTAHRVLECAGEGEVLLSGEHVRLLHNLGGWEDRLSARGQATVRHGLHLDLYTLHTANRTAPRNVPVAPAVRAPAPPTEPTDVVLLYRRNAQPDESVLAEIESALSAGGLDVYCDRSLRPGIESHRLQESRIRAARAVVPIISPRALRSELLQYALEAALDSRRERGAPALLPIQLGPAEPPGEDDAAIRDLLAPFAHFSWSGPQDTPRLIAELVSALREPLAPRDIPLEMVGGGMSPESPFYIERAADTAFHSLIERRHSIVLVRGGRQIGKTSLLARGMHRARERGVRALRTDFQKLSAESLAGPGVFYRHLAANLARQARFTYDFAGLWDPQSDAGQNFEYFLRDLLDADDTPVAWFLDEADKVFSASFANDFFGLVRTWHNDRAAEPDGPLDKLTIVIAYATEAHLFISDMNQSPFNVGERIALDDFTREQVLRLNDLYGGPVRSQENLERLHGLLGGHPYLTRRALDVLAREQESFESLLEDAARDDGPFSDHLKRVLASISALESVTGFVRKVADRTATLSDDQDAYFRLLRAGVLQQDRDGRIAFRCDLYRRYIDLHLNSAP